MTKKTDKALPEDDPMSLAAETAAGKLSQARAGRGGGKRTSKRTGRPKGTKSKPEKPGRVVAIGADVPTISEMKAEEAAREQFEQETRRRPGQPEGYHPRYAEIAKAMCKLGASDMDLARQFDVNVSTIWNWRSRHEEFFRALCQGKDAFDDVIERSLAQRAAGYSIHTEKLFHCEGTVIRAETIEHYPPDVGAIKLWLGNRRPDRWKDKQQVELDNGGAFLKLLGMISNGTAPPFPGETA